MSKYQPLADHLKTLAENEWRASFAEVEAVLGFALPKSASTHGSWWSNEPDKPHKTGWLDAGWRVADVDRREGKVVFERATKKKAPASPVAMIAASPGGEPAQAGPAKGPLLAIVAGATALALGLGVAAARLLRRK